MIEALPWIVFLAVVAAAVGYVAGRRSLQSSPPAAGGKGVGPSTRPDATLSDATRAPFALPIPNVTPQLVPKAARKLVPNAVANVVPAPVTVPVSGRSEGAPVANRSIANPMGASAMSNPVSDPSGLLGQAKSWGYQLQNLNLKRAETSPFDVLVVDYAKDGSDESALKPAEIERLKTKPEGGRRIVLAYCSIGEAESYRSYWQKSWTREKPAWLLGENPEWEENYSVCFWDPGWQSIVCGNSNSLIDRIIAQGFDGVYLDKCDVYEDLREHFKPVARSRPDLEGDMVGFVRRISSAAKAKRPGFLVVMQNAEALLERAELRQAIDAVAKEELLFGLDRPEKPNARDEIDESRQLLDLMKKDGKPVFAVEYLNTPSRIDEAAAAAQKLGYILYVAPKDRELDRLNGPVGGVAGV